MVRKFSEDVRMKLGIDKCAKVRVEQEKFEQGGDIILMDGQTLANLEFEENIPTE